MQVAELQGDLPVLLPIQVRAHQVLQAPMVRFSIILAKAEAEELAELGSTEESPVMRLLLEEGEHIILEIHRFTGQEIPQITIRVVERPELYQGVLVVLKQRR